jgi:hypothetical protein
MAIGMSAFGSVAADGTSLGAQAANETDDERRRRLEAQRQARLTGTTGAAALASVGAINPAGSIGGVGLGRFGL